ncbi:MAG: hypothetical protein IPM39_04250 [Chloroflexi bacterium]|nr:hypothetical protein [Chloroflexota bacterium]
MANKTDRIISYLPATFQKRPHGPTLRAVVDAFGRQLQDGENSLAAVMQAHWVDYADLLAQEIDDLARIAALYGLAPRDDEGVEEFREHLKRYVRTFLDGTVTVQGVLRITAEALGLHIADAYEEMDTWWTRDNDAVTLSEAGGGDAAELVLGLRSASEHGRSATAALVKSATDLSGKVDGRTANILRLQVNGTGPFEIDIAASAADPAAVSGSEIAAAINAEVGLDIASFDGRSLTLATPERGAGQVIEVHDTLNDAADTLLGLPPRSYNGRDEEAAIVRGTVDLSGVLDLREARYLRLLLDGSRLAEIDVAGPDEAHTLLDQVVEAINTALGLEDAVTHDGRFLILQSPTPGLGSSIVFQQAAAQQALGRLFGPISKTHVGRGPRAAQVIGRRDLSGGVDLTTQPFLRLRLDGATMPDIDCRGGVAANTQLPELVAAINEGVGGQIAAHNGRFLTLTSPTSGSGSEIVFLTPDGGDAARPLFGIGPRDFFGRAATPASIVGAADLSDGVDLLARYLLRLVVDGRPLTINLRSHAANIRAATLRQLADAIDAAVGADVAATDGRHLILVSATEGSGSSLVVEPLVESHRDRFVSRAIITDEAAGTIFGFTRAIARGADALNARVVGQVDLQRGVDLRQNRYLRLRIDGGDAVEIDCAGTRPRATLLPEIVDAINHALNRTPTVASSNGRRLILSSHTVGANSRITFAPPRVTDALPLLLDAAPGEFRGQNAEQVRFVGTVDLSGGANLSSASAIKLGLDGAAPIEIECAANAADPASASLNEIVIAINLALGRNVVTHDGAHLIITSPTVGAGSQLLFAAPAAANATAALFGIAAPREYRGRDASPAQVIGAQDLSGGVDLRVIRFLRLGIDGKPPLDVDCLLPNVADAAAVTLDEIVAAINAALKAKVAAHDGKFLSLLSPTVGQNGRIILAEHSSGDARAALFGSVPDETTGADPVPAILEGQTNLLTPVNLSRRSHIRLAVNGGLPTDIDVAGDFPPTTFADDMADAINAVFPDMASVTADNHLRLTAPSAGQNSRLELLPLRALDVIEYPPTAQPLLPQQVTHGGRWHADNSGAAAGYAEVSITAPLGVAAPTLVNEALGWQVRLLVALARNETARLWVEDGRLQSEIRNPKSEIRPIPGNQILVGPLGGQTWVPFDGVWQLSGDDDGPPTLQLNNSLADNLVQLVARHSIQPGSDVGVSVTAAAIPPIALDAVRDDGQVVVVNGRLHPTAAGCHLLDADGHFVADVRAGAGISLADFADRVVRLRATIHADAQPLLLVQQVEALFSVTLRFQSAEGDAITEAYEGVTIGGDPAADEALIRRIGQRPSAFVRAVSWPKATVLSLPQGRSSWRFLDCYGPRFNHARFDQARFPGGVCLDRGVFNVSRFANTPPEPVVAVFTSIHDLPDPPVQVSFAYERYQPGAFLVRLPADLPERFGGRFNQARFGQGKGRPEVYETAVTDPPNDDLYIVKLLNTRSALVEAQIVPRVPLGWTAVPMPFRDPHYLTLGSPANPAQIYLTDVGIDGFLRIQAREPGAFGNNIAIAARSSGPAMFDFSVIYEGVPFENARQTVLGRPLSALTTDSLEPGPVGVLQAKAAGVSVRVIRERTREVG